MGCRNCSSRVLVGEERINLAMAEESAGGGFRFAPATEVQSDLLKRRFIGRSVFIFIFYIFVSLFFSSSREWLVWYVFQVIV